MKHIKAIIILLSVIFCVLAACATLTSCNNNEKPSSVKRLVRWSFGKYDVVNSVDTIYRVGDTVRSNTGHCGIIVR